MKRFILAFAFAIVAVGGTMAVPRSASAQEILLEGPLAGAPAVRKTTQFRKLRFSIGPQFAYNFLGRYTQHFLIGGRAEFNALDWLGIGLVGYYSMSFPTKLTEHVSSSSNIGGTDTTPTDSNWPSYTGAANFKRQVAELQGMYLAQLNFVPLRGKMSMFEKVFVAVDGSIFVGGGVVQYKERKNCDGRETGNNDCGNYWGPNGFREGGAGIDELSQPRDQKFGGAFTWGVGVMAYFTNWFAVNIEFRMTPFQWNEGGTDEAGQSTPSEVLVEGEDGQAVWQTQSTGSGDYPNGRIGKEDRSWNLNMNIALGFIFLFPTKPTVGK